MYFPKTPIKVPWWIGKPAIVVQFIQICSERSRCIGNSIMQGKGNLKDFEQITSLIQYMTERTW